jgi:glycosyltransferase involved in cell wall biosynthesis
MEAALSLSQSPSVVVVTASVGRPELRRCIESVRRQDYAGVRHLVVVDGPEYGAAATGTLDGVELDERTEVLILPHNTGRPDNYGYRIYGAMSLLVNDDLVAFLDEDNWFEPDHVSAAVGALLGTGASWAYSLRRVCGQDGEPICEDDCDSLGHWPKFASMLSVWEIAREEQVRHVRYPNLVDTSCYLLPRPVAREVSPLLYGPDADSIVASYLVANHAGVCSGRSTVNYALGGTSGAPAEWFTDGNERLRELYGSAPLPWRQEPYRIGPGSLAHPI